MQAREMRMRKRTRMTDTDVRPIKQNCKEYGKGHIDGHAYMRERTQAGVNIEHNSTHVCVGKDFGDGGICSKLHKVVKICRNSSHRFHSGSSGR